MSKRTAQLMEDSHNLGYRGGYLDGYTAGYRDASSGYKEALDKLVKKEINWKSLHEYLNKTAPTTAKEQKSAHKRAEQDSGLSWK